MLPAFEDDLLASAIVALAHQLHAAPECCRVADAALDIIAMPADTVAEVEEKLRLLKAAMGFGPLGRVEGRA